MAREAYCGLEFARRRYYSDYQAKRGNHHSVIVLVKRRNKALISNENMILAEGDCVFLYTQQHLLDVNEIEI